jgi:hypothetical protein
MAGVITILFMWSDWLLTIAQEKERKNHYFKHYQGYPHNTIEGNPYLQKAISKQPILYARHLIVSLIIGGLVAFALLKIPPQYDLFFLSYVWGIFLIVDSQHLSNLFGYWASRKGIHGQLKIHLRTSLLIQSGRYLSMTLFLFILALFTQSEIIYGVCLAAFTSSLRQFIWLKRTPPFDEDKKNQEVSSQ